MIIAVTGHRPNKLGGNYDINAPFNKRLRQIMKDFVEEKLKEANDTITMISGMALGVDTQWALAALELRAKYPGRILLEAAIPCLNQDKFWRKESKETYRYLIKEADIVTYVSKKEYAPYLMQRRNEYMVNKADILLAIWDGSQGGTANCIKYAQKVKKEIVFINPKEIKI